MTASEQTSPARPRIFISYSHDSPAHCRRVLDLAQQLRRDGINTELDQFHQEEVEHWPRWCEEQLRPETLISCSVSEFDRLDHKSASSDTHFCALTHICP